MQTVRSHASLDSPQGILVSSCITTQSHGVLHCDWLLLTKLLVAVITAQPL